VPRDLLQIALAILFFCALVSREYISGADGNGVRVTRPQLFSFHSNLSIWRENLLLLLNISRQ